MFKINNNFELYRIKRRFNKIYENNYDIFRQTTTEIKIERVLKS